MIGIRQILAVRAEKTPDAVLFQYKNKKELVTVTCGQLWREVNSFGAFFYTHGLRDTRIALLGENSYHWILTWFAVVLSGNVAVPLDKDQSPDELSVLLRRCGAEALVCSGTYFDVAQKLHADGAAERILSMEDIPLVLEHSTASLDALGVETDPDDVCTILFTSGTTGTPKGVMLTQRNIARNAMNACRSLWVAGSSVEATGSSVLTLPLHHTFGFTVGVLSAYIIGNPVFISRSLRTFSGDVKSFGPQDIVVVPLYVETMYKNIWKAAKERGEEEKLRRAVKLSRALRRVGIDLRKKLFRSVLDELGGNLDHLVCGGAYLDQRYIDGMDDFGVEVLNGYGITECSPVVSVNRSGNRRAGSIGLPLPGVEVRIIDGEICVRGDSVMAGYFEDEASTREVMEDGWFHTGDLGRMDDDGFLYMTGRKKNLIILSNGENVSAEELEEKIMRIGNVEEVVVSAEDNAITAEIYAEDRSGIDDAVAALNRQLPPFKRIAKVRYRLEEFEKTTTRKIKRIYKNKERV